MMNEARFDGGLSFLRSIYWTFATMSTVGFGDIRPYSISETITSIFVMIFAIMMYPGVIANVSQVTAEGENFRSRAQSNMECASHFLKYHEVNDELREHVREYFMYKQTKHVSFWLRAGGGGGGGEGYFRNPRRLTLIPKPPQRNVDTAYALAMLPKHIQKAALKQMYMRCIKSSQLLAKINKTMVELMCSHTRTEVVLPSYYVARQGDYCLDLNYVMLGALEEHSGSKNKVLRTLKAGDIFGEREYGEFGMGRGERERKRGEKRGGEKRETKRREQHTLTRRTTQ